MDIIKINFLTKFNSWTDSNSAAFPTRLSLIVCIILALGGIILGTIEDSLAVTTNGLIAAVDILNSLLLLSAVTQSMREPDFIYNYGYGKYESLSIFSTATLLILILAITLYDAILGINSNTQVGNYFILLGYSIISLIITRRMSIYMKKSYSKFQLSILDFDKELWKIDSFIELGVIINLISGSILSNFNLLYLTRIIDIFTSVILISIALIIPLKHARNAINQLLDRTLPENVQFDILGVIAENIKLMCEFKSVHTRQSGRDIFIEIDIVLPSDHTLKDAFRLEKQIQEKIREKYPTASTRLYVEPCKDDCIYKAQGTCPVFQNLQN